MNLVCWLRGHKLKFVKAHPPAGIYENGVLILPVKEYVCECCGKVRIGCPVTKEDWNLIGGRWNIWRWKDD
jgi:ferredoxin-like protein FixX